MKPTYGDPEPLINETKYTVSKEFILEAYEAASPEWKTNIEKAFPEIFHKGDKVIFTSHPKDDFPNEGIQEKIFYFSIGDRVLITDGSYHTHPNGIKVKGLGMKQPKGIIVYNRCDRMFESYHSNVSLNLVIQLEDGTIIFSAPNCVQKIY